VQRDFDFKLEREIHIGSGDRIEVGVITIGGIERVERLNCWGCKWSISEIHPHETFSYGEDALQALNRCLLALIALIRSAEENGLEIWWLEPGDHCGLISELGSGDPPADDADQEPHVDYDA
jgi:hypothetical protein